MLRERYGDAPLKPQEFVQRLIAVSAGGPNRVGSIREVFIRTCSFASGSQTEFFVSEIRLGPRSLATASRLASTPSPQFESAIATAQSCGDWHGREFIARS